MASIDDYLALVPSANADQPNFMAMVAAFVQPFVDIQNAFAAMPGQFDLDDAIGAQLDAVGVRVGLSRDLSVPITGVYFALDTAGVGLDQGVLLGPFDPIDGLTSIDDDTYRLFLRIKIQANYWDGSFGQLQMILGAIAGSGTFIFAQDNFDMTYTIGVAGIVPSALFVALLRQTNNWLRPAAVAVNLILVTSVSGAPIFGLDVENDYIAGLDVGALATPY